MFLGLLKLFRTRTRFLILVLLLLCLASTWMNILSFNFALICFLTPQDQDLNSTTSETSTRSAVQFNPRQKSYLTAAVAASALISNFIVVQLVNRFGIRTIFTIAGLISALGTFLLPTAIYSGFFFTLGCRILQGVCYF